MKWNPEEIEKETPEEIEKETPVQQDTSVKEKPKKKETAPTVYEFKAVEKGIAKGY